MELTVSVNHYSFMILSTLSPYISEGGGGVTLCCMHDGHLENHKNYIDNKIK